MINGLVNESLYLKESKSKMINDDVNGISRRFKSIAAIALKRTLPDFYPDLFLFPITLRCNSKCLMCNIWKSNGVKEMPLKQIECLFKDQAFQSLKEVIITGGEPTLRKDFGSIMEIIKNSCPDIKFLQLATNGFNTGAVINACNSIEKAWQGTNLRYAILVSLDGVGKIHNAVRGVPHAFKNARKTVESLMALRRELNFGLHVNCVINRHNVYGLTDLINWCNRMGVKLTFQLAQNWRRFENDTCTFALTPKQKEYYLNLLWSKLKEPKASYYDWMTYRMINLASKRSISCPFLTKAFSISPDGSVYYCPNAKAIGNVHKSSFSKIYFEPSNLAYRKQIKQSNFCNSCIQTCWWQKAFANNLLQQIQYKCVKTYLQRTK